MVRMQILIVTSSRRLSRFRVLERSLRLAHPDAVIRALWCDSRLRTLPPDHAQLPQLRRFGGLRWADLVLALGERNAGWAAVPWLVDGFSKGEPIIVMDDSFLVCDSIEQLVESAESAPVGRAQFVDPTSGTAWGGILPGLVVLPAERGAYLRWWQDRSLETVFDQSVATPTWCSPYDGQILICDPAFRLTSKTASTIPMMISDSRIVMADQRPLALADFEGFDPRYPWWFATFGAEPSMMVSDSAALGMLCHDQANRLMGEGWTSAEDDFAPDEVNLGGGIRSNAALRRWYKGLLAQKPGPLPANPLVAGEVSDFFGLLAAPSASNDCGISTHAEIILEDRPDLQSAFPAVRGSNAAAFNRWMWTSGLSEGTAAITTLPASSGVLSRARSIGENRPFGVNLVGYLDAEMGLGETGRQLKTALEEEGIPVQTVSYDSTTGIRGGPNFAVSEHPYFFNILVLSPDQIPRLTADLGADFLDGHYNIGQLYWESDAITADHDRWVQSLDEVWTATTYMQQTFEQFHNVPVSRIPSPLVFDVPPSSAAERTRLGFDERFTFLFSFDFMSEPDRKNPIGLVDAYSLAFGPNDGTRLILKSINGKKQKWQREKVLDAIRARPDIELWDRFVSSSDRLALLSAADCYVSLHRCEGLGLTMAEAMAAGTPVIATDYSGNVDFMDESSAMLVPASVIKVGPGHFYPADGHWADPNLEIAVDFMRAVRSNNPSSARPAGAVRSALAPFGYAEVGKIAGDRLIEIWNETRGG
jgi:glycosyltransferase involved in cell wall biosynthesis